MFGHQDDDKQDANSIPDESIKGVLNDHATPANPEEKAAPDFMPDPVPAPQISDQPWQHPGSPIDNAPTPPAGDVISPAGGFPKQQTFPQANQSVDPPKDDPAPSDDGDGDLVEIKQHALTELAPLIDDLDLGPEEKFRALMMMIQASDDQKLVPKAYEAAHNIPDEKARAQALLDIVNEINYFTHQPEIETGHDS